MTTALQPAGPSLATLARSAKVLICCGPGGVGKTTTAATIAVWAAAHGRRTCVLTIDPARRLAQALGLDGLDNSPRPVAMPAPDHGGSLGGSLDAMMLDPRSTFDEVVRRNARSSEQAERILSNPIYRRLTSVSGTQEYMAMEKLHELHASGRWDLLVVDTPPTRSALDFLDAPDRLYRLLDQRLRTVTAPLRKAKGFLRGLGIGASPLTGLVGRVTGIDLLREVTDFVAAFDGMYEGFKERARRVRDLLHQDSTAFVVVATPDEAALLEGAFFAGRLAGDHLRLGAIVVNRITTAATLPMVPAARRKVLAGGDDDQRLLAALLDRHADRATLAAAEQQRINTLLAAVPAGGATRVQVPLLAEDLTDLAGLRRLGGHLLEPA
jgi:anion-transporting  ArsA/GET3 family ATPase